MKFCALVRTQTGREIKAMRFNGGKEYINQKVKDFLAKNGTQIEITAPYSSPQNGVAECLNRTLIEHVHTILIEHNLPKFLWPEAVAYATYLKNCSSTRALKDTTP